MHEKEQHNKNVTTSSKRTTTLKERVKHHNEVRRAMTTFGRHDKTAVRSTRDRITESMWHCGVISTSYGSSEVQL
jgi:hypothetical protein